MSLSGPLNDTQPVAFCSLNGKKKNVNVGAALRVVWGEQMLHCNIIGKMLLYFALRNL
jgi:hypothetical protein